MGIGYPGFSVATPPEHAGSLSEKIAKEHHQETQQHDHVEAGPSSPLSQRGCPDLEISTPGPPRKLRRSSCPPPCTSSPDSNHSSETLLGTPRESEAISPKFTEFRCAIDKPGIPDNHCWLVLAEYLREEEQDAEKSSWETVVEWMKSAHQTEIAGLQSQVFVAETVLEAREVDLANQRDDHEADLRVIETLTKERSDLRKRLSERSTELRNAKKEIKTLQRSLEETLVQRSAEEVSAERVGIESAARVTELETRNERLEENFEYATQEITRLRSEAITTRKELKELRAQNHFAQLEVGHLHATNAGYRSELEDSNPARTAHIDGYLKCKDEAFTELEMRAASCAEELSEEKRNRAVDNVYAEAKISGLNQELAHRSNMIATLTEAREILQEQKEEIFQMFQKKIFSSDIEETFRHDYHVIRKDNTLLNKVINERQFYLEDAEKPVADLKADKIILEHAARSDQLKQRQMQQSINGLEAKNGELQDRLKVLAEMSQEAEEDFNAKIKQQAEEIERLLWNGAEDGWRRRSQVQAQELVNCRGEITRLAGLADQWRTRTIEVQDDFCPMFNMEEVRDWTAEESRWRLHHAERRAAELERELVVSERKFKEAVREGKKVEVREPEQEG